MILLDIEKELAKRHKPNVVLASGEARIRATEEVGNKIGVSHATFERAKAVMDSKPSEEAKDKTTFTRTRFYRIFLVDILLLHHMLGCRSLS